MPEIVISPTLRRIGDYLLRKLCMLPDEAPDYMSEHYRGAEAMLSEHLEEQ